MKKQLLILTLFSALLSPALTRAQSAPPGEWRLHNSYHHASSKFGFDKKIIDTPDKVYLLSLGLGYWSWSGSFGTEYPFLFVYDKKEDVMEGYNARNYIHGNVVKDMWYNPSGKYLLLVYDDYNMDILHTDDRCYNVPGLASAVVAGSKDINSVTFHPAGNRAYLATKFGYLVVDDSKNVIAESHIYNVDIAGIARVGDRLVACTADGIFTSEATRNDKHSAWSSFTKVADSPAGVKNVLPLNATEFLYVTSDSHLFKGVFDAEGNVTLDGKDLANTNITRYTEIPGGYFFGTGWAGVIVNTDGSTATVPGSSEYRSLLYTATSPDDIWITAAPNGIQHLRYDGSAWSVRPSKAYGPNIMAVHPAAFDVSIAGYSPTYGMVMCNSGYAHFHGSTDVGYNLVVSQYKNGDWTNNVETIKGDATANIHMGLLDPCDDNILWAGSGTHGLVKYDLGAASAKKFIPGGGSSANCQTIGFDGNETLWTIRRSPAAFYAWSKEDRQAENASGIKKVAISGFVPGTFSVLLPCAAESNKNLLIASAGVYDSGLYVYDHRGTLDNSSDDRYIFYTALKDQDGQAINISYVYAITEDPATGRVWVGGEGGLYWFNPTEAFNSDFHVNRVKVARNDGTGLADYLLEGSSVYTIAIDGAGHKWFGTLGNGAVETNASGNEIIRQLTSDNSYLPSDDVISFGFEPDSNCVWIGTKKGIAQYFSETAPSADNLDGVLAYPNPVRPDYYGYVTVKGLMDGTLVKILDASGALVRELGRSEGGMVLWDLNNMAGRRVPTGIYYVAASTSGDSAEGHVAKIAVIN